MEAREFVMKTELRISVLLGLSSPALQRGPFWSTSCTAAPEHCHSCSQDRTFKHTEPGTGMGQRAEDKAAHTKQSRHEQAAKEQLL